MLLGFPECRLLRAVCARALAVPFSRHDAAVLMQINTADHVGVIKLAFDLQQTPTLRWSGAAVSGLACARERVTAPPSPCPRAAQSSRRVGLGCRSRGSETPAIALSPCTGPGSAVIAGRTSNQAACLTRHSANSRGLRRRSAPRMQAWLVPLTVECALPLPPGQPVGLPAGRRRRDGPRVRRPSNPSATL